jgi:hypothetical protein
MEKMTTRNKPEIKKKGMSSKSARLIRNDDTQDMAVMQIRITAPPVITPLRARSYLNASLMLIIWMRPYLTKNKM